MTLPAKAGGFSGHARASAPRSVLIAPSERKDVSGGICVSVGYVSTRADVHPIRERLFDLRHRAARRASLRRVPGIDRDHSRTSIFRFVREYLEELRPARVVRGLREPGPRDALDVEGFVGDQAVAVYQLTGLLVVEVSSLVRRLLVQTSDFRTSLTAAMGAFLLPGYGALRPPEFLLSLPVVARRLNRLVVGRYEEALQPEVNANSRTTPGGFGRIPELAGEDHVPFPASPLDGDGLDGPFERAMQLDLDVSDVLEVEPLALLEPTTAPVRRELDGSKPILRLEPRIARSLTGPDAAEESRKRSIQPTERSLGRREVEGGETSTDPPGFFEPPRLLAVGTPPDVCR